ncbi:hypothetical protein Shyd_69740 [Streptomyces hydrogenans]|uniref:Uncharacterized protein n=1 Tax=Streptomyces hydrogenans TaxID=1873719 RepID=A0ABQ3PKR1_9ACTN|nr:hypothetical protein Shyd_69740 [Streptomyces hydrogenans]
MLALATAKRQGSLRRVPVAGECEAVEQKRRARVLPSAVVGQTRFPPGSFCLVTCACPDARAWAVSAFDPPANAAPSSRSEDLLTSTIGSFDEQSQTSA